MPFARKAMDRAQAVRVADLLQTRDNDGHAAILGPRHPRCFGERYREAWPDTYPLIHPWMQRVLQRGEVVEVEREHIAVTATASRKKPTSPSPSAR